MQNIGGENAGDAFYRYKMPKLMAKIEGRGNGIKTNVVNNVDIAKALERPPEYILKFFGCELGAQTNYDKNTGMSIVNGAHDQGVLVGLLEAFIKKYVQCYSCGNPETVIKIKKDFISLKCKACGAVSDVDMRHKVNTFILKNPPENKLSKEEKRLKKAEDERMRDAKEGERRDKEKKEKKEKKDKKDKKDKKSKKKDGENGDAGGSDDAADGNSADNNAQAAAPEEEEDEEEEEEEVVWLTDTSEAAMKARAQEQLTAATAAMVTQGNIEAEAVEARKREKEAKKKKAAEEDARRRAALESGDKLDGPSATQLLRDLHADGGQVALSRALKKINVEGGLAGKMCALYACLFGACEGRVPTAMKEHKDILTAQSADGPQAQLAQLVALENLFGYVLGEDRLKEAPLALKFMYDEDIAAEEIIELWYERADAATVVGVEAEQGKAVRRAVAPVVEWLQQAEETESEDEED